MSRARAKRCELHGMQRSPEGVCAACEKEASRERGRVWMTVTLGLFFFAAVAVAAASVIRHRAPTSAEPPPPAPNPFVVIPVASAPSAEVPFAPPSFPTALLDIAAAKRGVSVTIYSASWCGYCQKAKAYMTANDVKFVERDVEADEASDLAMRKISPKGTIPAFDVEGDTWVGWSESRLESALDLAAKRRLAKK